MKWAQRWSVGEEGDMVMDDHGSWVENAYYEYLKSDYAVLKTDAQLVVKHLGEACADNLRLKADVVELADALKLASEVGIKVADEVTRLKAEVERLRTAGDAMYQFFLWVEKNKSEEVEKTMDEWEAAKEGKQP